MKAKLLETNSLLEEGASRPHGGNGIDRVNPVQASGSATPLLKEHLVMTVPESTPGIRDPAHLPVACARGEHILYHQEVGGGHGGAFRYRLLPDVP